ncbi:MAG: hypothetical protein PHC75_09580 [Burkholderiales bacterium]|nr:hypothetical protein [Burkholderiales bacterium]
MKTKILYSTLMCGLIASSFAASHGTIKNKKSSHDSQFKQKELKYLDYKLASDGWYVNGNFHNYDIYPHSYMRDAMYVNYEKGDELIIDENNFREPNTPVYLDDHISYTYDDYNKIDTLNIITNAYSGQDVTLSVNGTNKQFTETNAQLDKSYNSLNHSYMVAATDASDIRHAVNVAKGAKITYPNGGKTIICDGGVIELPLGTKVVDGRYTYHIGPKGKIPFGLRGGSGNRDKLIDQFNARAAELGLNNIRWADDIRGLDPAKILDRLKWSITFGNGIDHHQEEYKNTGHSSYL